MMTASCAQLSAALKPPQAKAAPPAPLVVPPQLLEPCTVPIYVFPAGVCTMETPSQCTPCTAVKSLADAERAHLKACATRHAELAKKVIERNAQAGQGGE